MSKVYRIYINLFLRILEIIKYVSIIIVNWKYDLLWFWESKIYLLVSLD